MTEVTNVDDYEGIIESAKDRSIMVRELAAQLIPKFFKFFPTLADKALDSHFDLCEDEQTEVRAQAIQQLPVFSEDAPRYLPRIVDILAQLLAYENNVGPNVLHEVLMSLLRQDVKVSLTALFKRLWCLPMDESIREKVLSFISEKVFPLKTELLKPQDQMERHITNLIKKSMGDVTGAEFIMFMNFIQSLSIFGEEAPPERVKELMEIIEGQADLDAGFNVSDEDHIDRLISCLNMAVPLIVKRGAPNSKFLQHLNKDIMPVFEKLPEEKKLYLLSNFAEISPLTIYDDSVEILPSIHGLFKNYMPWRESVGKMDSTYVECLLYIFHSLAKKAPNFTKKYWGYEVQSGLITDLIESQTEAYRMSFDEFTEWLVRVENLALMAKLELIEIMARLNEDVAAAKSAEEKDSIKIKKKNTTNEMNSCANILAMIKPLQFVEPAFGVEDAMCLSWREAIIRVPSVG